MYKIAILVLVCVMIAPTSFAIPDNADFEIQPDFPQPAGGSSGVVGTNTESGRFLIWNGDEVFLQSSPPDDRLSILGSGYSGDPAFITISPSGDTALLGQGFGDGVNANVYVLDLNAPADFNPGDEIQIQNHFSGVFLNDNLVAFDRGDFGFPAEIIVLELFPARHARSATVSVMQLPPPPAGRTQVVEKPAGSFSASLAVYNGLLYVADSGNGQYKSFAVPDVINAFNTATPLLWAMGTDIGTPFAYPTGGVSGVTASGNLVIAGFGSIVEVNPGTGVVEKSIDPAGTAPFYGLIYNQQSEEMIAVEFPLLFGDPLIFHASKGGFTSLPAQTFWTMAALGLFTALCGALVLRRGKHSRGGSGPISAHVRD